MPMQQVNLYLPEFRPKKEWLTLQNVTIAFGVYFVLLVVAYQVAQTDLENLEATLASKEDVIVRSEERLQKYNEMTKSINVVRIDEEIAQLRAEVLQRQHVSSVIEGQQLGNESGFSAQLMGLSRQSFNSIALERFRLSRGGAYLEMQGVTKSPSDVAFYVEKLRTEASFERVGLGALSVGESEKSSDYSFALGFDSMYQAALKRERQ